MTARVVTNNAGTDLALVEAAISTSTPEIPAHTHVYGEQVTATDGSIWVYAKAGGTITQYDTVAIDSNFTGVTAIVGGAAGNAGHCIVGFCQNAGMTSGQAGWFMIHGKPTLRILDAVPVDAMLFTTDQAGVLTDTTTTGSQFPVLGVFLVSAVVSATASIQNGNAVADFPHLGPKVTPAGGATS